MSVPESVLYDGFTRQLASYFDEYYAFLVSQGVPPDRLPSPWHMLSHVISCVDIEQMQDWLDAYVSMEAEEVEVTEEMGTPSEKPLRHRPPYLRALRHETDNPGERDDRPDRACQPPPS